MAQTIRFRRGVASALPNTGLVVGEPLFTTDKLNLYIADSATTAKPATPDIEALTGMTTPATTDLVMMTDISEAAGQREKKVSFVNFKAALNIPESSTDELVAASNGTVSGYLDEILVSSSGALTFAVNANDLDADIADAGVLAIHLAANSVTTAKITDGNVTTVKIANDAITTAKLANTALNLGAVFTGSGVDTTLSIATGGITTAMIANDAITSAKMSNTFLNLDTTVFTGTGIDTQLTVSTIDGGTF